jgi:CRISPR/Cas system-associated exonuclease Cas4 (RecB family)
MDRNLLLKVLYGTETKRDKQQHIGPSEIGGCRRRLWYRLNQQPKMNDTYSQPSAMGTAWHTFVESKFKAFDPFRFELEVEVESDGLMGHVDCYDTEQFEVIDWKTSKKSSAKNFPTEQQRLQVQLYGYLLNANGKRVDWVTLVLFVRDGDETHMEIHTEPYDESVAAYGLDWLAKVRTMVEAPEPQMPKRMCQNYCPYYDSSGRVGCEAL